MDFPSPTWGFSFPTLSQPHGPCRACLPSPVRAGATPLRPMWPPGMGGPSRWPSGTPGKLPKTPETFPGPKTGLPIYKSLPPDHSGAPRDVRDLIWDSEQSSVTTIHNSTIPKRHRTLSVQTLRVGELCRHDRDTSMVLEICPRGNNKLVIIIFPCS